jgi:hypothetical protein
MLERIRRDDGGAALVEMAAALVLLLMLLFAAADLGRLFHSYIILRNASREGARYASHLPDMPGFIRDTVRREAANAGVTLADADIGIDPDPNLGTPILTGNPITVSVEYQFDTIIGGLVGLDSITVRAATEMVVFGRD